MMIKNGRFTTVFFVQRILPFDSALLTLPCALGNGQQWRSVCQTCDPISGQTTPHDSHGRVHPAANYTTLLQILKYNNFISLVLYIYYVSIVLSRSLMNCTARLNGSHLVVKKHCRQLCTYLPLLFSPAR